MTLPELEKKLNEAKVPAAMYSLDGGMANGTYCIDRAGNEWEIYYASGGKKTVIDTAATLEGAYDSFWNAVSIKMEFHKMARTANHKRSWNSFWVCGILFGLVFAGMGGINLWIYMNDPSKAAPLPVSIFFVLMGLCMIGPAAGSMASMNIKKKDFIYAFVNDEFTACYSQREEAAGELWKQVKHFMEKETLWSKYKLKYSREWLMWYGDELEKYR